MQRWHLESSTALKCLRRSLFRAQTPLLSWPCAPRRTLYVASRIKRTRRRTSSIFERIEQPTHDPDAWASLLDFALPPHLRLNKSSPTSVHLSDHDVAEILLAAQYPSDHNLDGIDVLHHMGFTSGRWNAAVWLIKKLAEHFTPRHGRDRPLTKLVNQWSRPGSLRDITQEIVDLQPTEIATQSALTATLDELTDGPAEDTTLEDKLQHDALGQVWRTLGLMTQTCAGAEIKPEILEIIAFLHHKEIMPQSIYYYQPNIDKHAIQSPPSLSLLSSRILTSLSDAAWRAHEKLIVEEAKAKGGEYAALRPEIPGSVYRVHVAGLRPELWMELILWSCLRGGWILQGAEILQSICADSAWKPVSWQDHALQLSYQDDSDSNAWETWEYRFKTRAPDTMDAAPLAEEFHVDRTISSEVISAYADALVTSVSLGVGNRGTSMSDIVAYLQLLQTFLSRSKLGLGTGTWDALILRLIDHDHLVADTQRQLTQDLVSLSPDIHERLRFSAINHDLPDYVSDGNSAMQGLLHRLLRSQIDSGQLDAALRVLAILLDRADTDKLTSIFNFFREPRKSVIGLMDSRQMFTNNFSGIEYPAFDAQLPLPLLGSLMNLAVTTRAYDLCDWMIHSNDVDGPIITPQMYNNPYIQPALLHYAAETDDRDLFDAFTMEGPSRLSLVAVLDTQIGRRRWTAVTRLIEHLAANEHLSWGPQNLAVLVRTMLLLVRDIEAGSASAKQDLRRAEHLFTKMVSREYEGSGQMTSSRFEKIQTVVSVLATVGPRWQKLCEAHMQTWHHHAFEMGSNAFNVILEGVVEVYGSAAGRRILGIFWPHAARVASDNASAFGSRQTAQMRRYRPGILRTLRRQRIIVPKMNGNDALVIYGAATPTVRTILIILDKALRESEHSLPHALSSRAKTGAMSSEPEQSVEGKERLDLTPTGIVAWAVRRLLELPDLDIDLFKNLDTILAEHNLQDIRAELPRIVSEAGVRPSDLVFDDESDDNVDYREEGDALTGVTS